MSGREHSIEVDQPTFAAVASGGKTHDLRKGDFSVGDTVRYLEVDDRTGKRTLRQALAAISYITSAANPCALSDSGLATGFSILSIGLVEIAESGALATPHRKP